MIDFKKRRNVMKLQFLTLRYSVARYSDGNFLYFSSMGAFWILCKFHHKQSKHCKWIEAKFIVDYYENKFQLTWEYGQIII